jgi:hypothetical protein
LLLTAALSCRPFTYHCAMSARDVWGFSSLGIVCLGFALASGPQRRTTSACGWRASCGAAFRSWHGGHFGWLVLLTATLSCAPTEHHSHCAMSARDVRGFSVGYFVFWLARASEPLICTICACGFCRASWRSLGIARWSLRLLLTAALELCPFTHHCAISARDVRGISIFRLGTLCLGLLSLQGCRDARRVRVALA